uniref:Uncharacterized protein n=1 Tax=Romanomermis culicivorax TaxID=13658 RepID=A0A915K3L1_ROMCU
MEPLCGHSLFCPICERRLLHLYEHLTKLCMANHCDEIDDTIDRIGEKELKIMQNEVILKSQIICWSGCTDLIKSPVKILEKCMTNRKRTGNTIVRDCKLIVFFQVNEENDESDDDYVDDENIENEDEEEDRTELIPV